MDPIDKHLAADLTVLVVDDDAAALEQVVGQVKQLGFGRVLAAAGGAAALATLERVSPSIIISDLVMPGVDGAALLAEVKRRNPTIVVLIMSVVDSVDQAVRLLKSGADDYLTKPLAPDVLAARLEAVAERLAIRREADDLRQILDSGLAPRGDFIWGSSSAMLQVAARIPALARTDAAVVISGESGTGKELMARAIHYASRRARGPMLSVSCGSIPDTLWEREFFGHVKGAFSGAGEGGVGVIAAADRGTLFLDEVGEIPLAMQAKLLRFLQEKEYRPVGSTQVKRANVRIVSATNRDLEREVAAGRFREDLYYRINVLPLRLPPLRERKVDIPALASFFLRRYAAEFRRDVDAFSTLAEQKLCSHDFPGNVRELENVVQQAIVATRRSLITADDIPVGDPSIVERTPVERAAAPESGASTAARADSDAAAPARAGDDWLRVDIPYNEAKTWLVDRFERGYIERLLAEHDGNVSRAAAAADLPRRSFARVMKRHGIAGGPDGVGGQPGRPPAAAAAAAAASGTASAAGEVEP